MMEVAVLLSLMIRSSAEDTQLCLINGMTGDDVDLKSDVLLDNVRSVVKQAKVRNHLLHPVPSSLSYKITFFICLKKCF